MRLSPPVVKDMLFKKSVYLYFKDRIKVTEKYFLYDELSLLGNVGGYLGLC